MLGGAYGTYQGFKMKRTLFILVILIATGIASSEEISIPGTKVHLDISNDYFLVANNNMLMTKKGSFISCMEVEAPYEEARNAFVSTKNIISGVSFGDFILEQTNKAIFNVQANKQDELFLGYGVLLGSESSSVVLLGLLRKTNDMDLDSLFKILDSANYDENRVRDFSRIKYFTIESIEYELYQFFGDRFLFKYIGEKHSESDTIDFEIGSIFHNYNLTKDMYLDAAKSFSFRPPFNDFYTLISSEFDSITIGNLNGIFVKYKYFNKMMNRSDEAIEYILFSANRIYFLRSKIHSDNCSQYYKSIYNAFDSFKLTF